MYKIIVLVMVLFMAVPAIAADAPDLSKRPTDAHIQKWLDIVKQFEGYPYMTVMLPPVVGILILDKENPDPSNPVALDVRTPRGTPVYFYIYKDGKGVIVWRHPSLDPDINPDIRPDIPTPPPTPEKGEKGEYI